MPSVRGLLAFFTRDRTIKKHVKQNDHIVFGSQSLRAQLGWFAREPNDWDISSRRPRRDARRLERKLDREAGSDDFFSRPSFFKRGTHKVIHKGPDRRPNTRDDIGVADFSRTRPLRTTRVDGIRYSTLEEEARNRRMALRDKRFEFRSDKDRTDLNSIRIGKTLRRRRR